MLVFSHQIWFFLASSGSLVVFLEKVPFSGFFSLKYRIKIFSYYFSMHQMGKNGNYSNKFVRFFTRHVGMPFPIGGSVDIFRWAAQIELVNGQLLSAQPTTGHTSC